MDESLVKILDRGGGLRGTGFVFDPGGLVLTCHHVVDGLDGIVLEGAAGNQVIVPLRGCVLVPDQDLAVLPCAVDLGPALAIAETMNARERYSTKGFHRLGESIVASFPVDGRIAGTTTVRYATATTEYEISNALVLRDDALGEGLSGAPVLDPSTGSVIGVVSTMLHDAGRAGGFAVPLTRQTAPTLLRSYLTQNAARVPGYGRDLNLAGLSVLAQRQRERALAELAALRRVDLAARVPRSSLKSGLDEAFSKGARIVAMVGPSGVGKSTEVAALAKNTDTAAVVLLRGSALDADCRSVGAAVAQAMGTGLDQLDADDQTAVLRGAVGSGGLLVLLDGLNETAIHAAALEEWLLRSHTWLRTVGARLVVSTRPELWDRVGPLLQRLGEKEVEVVDVGEFTVEEFHLAAEKLSVTVGAEVGIFRLPIMLSLYAQALATFDGPSGGVSLDQVIEAYVASVAERVAAAIGGPTRKESVVDWLREAARLMLEHDVGELDRATFRQVFPDALQAGDHVLGEGLMTGTDRGYRFVYDDIGDWLKADAIDLDRALADDGLQRLGAAEGWRHIGPIACALRDVARRHGESALVERLEDLLAAEERVGRQVVQLIAATVTKQQRLSAFLPLLQRLADVADLYSPPVLGRRFWVDLDLPVEGKLSLLRTNVCRDSHWGWRSKDWGRVPVPSQLSYGGAALAAASTDPARALVALGPWLADERPLRDGEARVVEVAKGIAFRLAEGAPAAVGEFLAQNNGRVGDLVGALAARRPAALVDATLLCGSAVLAVAASSALAAQTQWDNVPERKRRELLGLVRSALADPQLPPVRIAALALLAERDADDRALGELLSAFRESDQVSAWTLVGMIERQDVLAALLDVLRSDRDRRDDVLGALATGKGEHSALRVDAAVAQQLRRGEIDADYALARYIEDRLYRSARLSDDLLTLLDAIVSSPSSTAQVCLVYPLTSCNVLPEQPEERFRLLRRLLDAHPAQGAQVVRGLAEHSADDREAGRLAAHAITLMDSEEAETELLLLVWTNPDAGAVALEWLSSGVISAPGPAVSRMVDLCRAGANPEDAAGRALEERAERNG